MDIDGSDASKAQFWDDPESQDMARGTLKAILGSTIDAIITIDESCAIQAVNEAAQEMFGYGQDELLGRNVSVLMPNPFRSEHDGYVRDYVLTGQAKIIGYGRRVMGRRKDGTTFPAQLAVGETQMNGRRFFTGILRDVTEQRDLEAKLAVAERLAAIGELAAGVAHEVNNPVNTMINCAQLIKDGDRDETLCDHIISEGERVSQIVRSLLSFARNRQDSPSATRVEEVVDHTVGLVNTSFRNQGVNIMVVDAEALPVVRARAGQLQQVFLNLLINAKDALIGTRSRKGGERTIRVSMQLTSQGGRDFVRTNVHDNGPGIPPEHFERIFDTFFTTKKSRGGTGLGLSIARGIVEDHGGRIEVRSEVGNFTEFRVWLPILEKRHPGVV